ncbi:LacI family DNA-binding transcriptional regulator [Arthrobacter sp. LAPM80]|uniref:LacI family DNA-binding transcriptional regulator n=1 Tax=Arthrobacter sp. LAPM80 TaxID=3141788 RepID=UPI00398B8B78
MNKRITMLDVADAAGVSPATASRALSGNPKVDPELARRVVDASIQLGYSANAMARALRTRRTDTIGVVVPGINNPYFPSIVEALEGILAESNRSLILCNSRQEPVLESSRIDLLINRMVDGLVVIPVSTRESAAAVAAAAQRVPLVQLDRYAEAPGTDYVGSDNTTGLRLLMDHLRDMGCRTFAYVGAHPTTSSAHERHTEFRALTAPQRPAAPHHWELLGDFSMEWGSAAARLLLAGGPLPDAIICGADVVAIGLLAVLNDAGIGIPAQVKIGSFDDVSLSLITTPKLTSVRHPVADLARETIRLLDERSLNRGGPGRKSIFCPQLMVRESTAGLEVGGAGA